MGARIRPGREDDFHAVRVLDRAAGALFADVGLDVVVGNDVTLEELAEHLHDGTFWVAVDERDHPIGYALGGTVDGEGHLHQVAVHPESGRRGIGRALMEAVCAWAGERGLESVTLTTYQDVAWNGPVYERLGWMPIAESDLGPELAAIRASERARGYDVQARTAMRRHLR